MSRHLAGMVYGSRQQLLLAIMVALGTPGLASLMPSCGYCAKKWAKG